MLQFLKESNTQVKEERARKQELRERYRKETAAYKLRGNIAQRDQMHSRGDVIKETGTYSLRFLFLRIPNGDEVLYKYKRKL